MRAHFAFWETPPEAIEAILRLKAERAGLRVLRDGWRLAGLLAKANFDPAQPRVPAGEADGGRWTGGGAGSTRMAANDRSGAAANAGKGSNLMPAKIPPKVSVDDNIKMAEFAHKLLSPGQALLWFYLQVRNHAPWDYKNTSGHEYADFGNFNYGATGAALGIPDATLLRMAGWAQTRSGNTGSGVSPGFLDSILGFGGKPPFGDDPADQIWIERGIRYYRAK